MEPAEEAEPSASDLDLAKLRSLVEKHQKDNELMRQENEELKRKLAESTAKNAKTQAKLDTNLDNKELEAKLLQQEKESKNLERRTVLQLRTIISVRSDLANCREERNGLEDEITKLKKDRDKHESEVDGLKKDRKRLEKELRRIKDSRNTLEQNVDELRGVLTWFMQYMQDKISQRVSKNKSMTEAMGSSKVDGARKEASGSKKGIDVAFLRQIEQFKSERDNLCENVENQNRIIGRLQADLDRAMSENARFHMQAKASKKDDMLGLRQALHRCELEKEQLQGKLTRCQLDVELLESKVRRQEEDKKHSDELSAMLKTTLGVSECHKDDGTPGMDPKGNKDKGKKEHLMSFN